ncbi:NYN domain limkain-b1-type [Arabidopsis suecica]|uniref:NYN domain limkain-b1-type n=1 Tax=Arabidopsis suecica TaxID=45249 RepID=A0A8T1ZRS9_ARASU|nr:NYN domain limkain-b1-type [Arabidopsis suecica]
MYYTNEITSVWWDVNSSPVPDGYDAGLVGPCIKKMLVDLGHIGPVTITATGDFRGTPEHVLRALSSSGIIIKNVGNGPKDLFHYFLSWTRDNPAPATVMIIAHYQDLAYMDRSLQSLNKEGYTFVKVYAHPIATCTVSGPLGLYWGKVLSGSVDNKPETRRQFLLDKCSETSETKDESACFFCLLCYFSGKSVESFTAHLSSEEHAQEELDNVSVGLPKGMKIIRGRAVWVKEQPKTLADSQKAKNRLKKLKRKRKLKMTSTKKKFKFFSFIW